MKNRTHWSSVLLATSIAAFGCAAADRPVDVPIKLLGNFPVVNVKIDGSGLVPGQTGTGGRV
jgi:hypothetical protein